mmetsp:Transcript_45828/g.88214  ORF Transcript_45828/g.88214 Transcript_45828/m.88214 type:complete len:80 (-) Transcript_45828:141-380(-)
MAVAVPVAASRTETPAIMSMVLNEKPSRSEPETPLQCLAVGTSGQRLGFSPKKESELASALESSCWLSGCMPHWMEFLK